MLFFYTQTSQQKQSSCWLENDYCCKRVGGKRQLSGEEISELASQISSSHKDNKNGGSNSLYVSHIEHSFNIKFPEMHALSCLTIV